MRNVNGISIIQYLPQSRESHEMRALPPFYSNSLQLKYLRLPIRCFGLLWFGSWIARYFHTRPGWDTPKDAG